MQPVIGTVVLKIGSTGLHCEGCMNRIRHKLFKIKGTADCILKSLMGHCYLRHSDDCICISTLTVCAHLDG
jgi:hypothetical protein